jgi:hypothetical protein
MHFRILEPSRCSSKIGDISFKILSILTNITDPLSHVHMILKHLELTSIFQKVVLTILEGMGELKARRGLGF